MNKEKCNRERERERVDKRRISFAEALLATIYIYIYNQLIIINIYREK